MDKVCSGSRSRHGDVVGCGFAGSANSGQAVGRIGTVRGPVEQPVAGLVSLAAAGFRCESGVNAKVRPERVPSRRPAGRPGEEGEGGEDRRGPLARRARPRRGGFRQDRGPHRAGEQRPLPATLRRLATALGREVGEIAPGWDADEEERITSGPVVPGLGPRALRRRAGVTLAAAAAAAGVSASTLSRFERGLHAARRITALGDGEHGAASIHALALTSQALASLLGFPSTAALTRACARIDDGRP